MRTSVMRVGAPVGGAPMLLVSGVGSTGVAQSKSVSDAARLVYSANALIDFGNFSTLYAQSLAKR
jgi:hypothetical protein